MNPTYQSVPTCAGEYDVIVAGGGPAGVAAALAAARHGAKVLVIEKKELLGGLATSGLVAYFCPLDDGNGYKITRGIVEELFFLSIKYSYNTLLPYWKQGENYASDIEAALKSELRYFDSGVHGRHNTMFNTSAFALAMEEVLLEAGVQILYDTLICDTVMDGAVCKGVIVEGHSGRRFYASKSVIDSTGYGVVFSQAGAEMVVGENYMTACATVTSFTHMKKGIETGQMSEALHWAGFGFNPAIHNEAGKVYRADSAEGVNEYILDMHKVLLDNLKARIARDSSYTYAETPSMNSIRQAKEIIGRDEIRPEDVFIYREDSVGCVNDWRKRGPVYEVPFGCLFDKNIKNIIAAGRIIAAVGDVWNVMRVYSGAMLTGQAAGTAAAIAASQGISPDEVDVAQLQSALEADNVLLHYEAPMMH